MSRCRHFCVPTLLILATTLVSAEPTDLQRMVQDLSLRSGPVRSQVLLRLDHETRTFLGQVRSAAAVGKIIPDTTARLRSLVDRMVVLENLPGLPVAEQRQLDALREDLEGTVQALALMDPSFASPEAPRKTPEVARAPEVVDVPVTAPAAELAVPVQPPVPAEPLAETLPSTVSTPATEPAVPEAPAVPSMPDSTTVAVEPATPSLLVEAPAPESGVPAPEPVVSPLNPAEVPVPAVESPADSATPAITEGQAVPVEVPSVTGEVPVLAMPPASEVAPAIDGNSSPSGEPVPTMEAVPTPSEVVPVLEVPADPLPAASPTEVTPAP